MDNKQATPTDLGYLAGMIDGEGCIRIQKNDRANGSSYGCIVKITNSDPNIIERLQSIYLSMGINPCLREMHNEGQDWKNWFDVFLTKKSLIKQALEATLPYLSGKKARATIMLRFINNSMDRDEAVEELKRLNQKGKPSETTREAPALLVEDIVHAA